MGQHLLFFFATIGVFVAVIILRAIANYAAGHDYSSIEDCLEVSLGDANQAVTLVQQSLWGSKALKETEP